MSIYRHWAAHTEAVLGRPAVTRAMAREGLAASEF
jgi:hypothetical protein